jgi:hypothetical protein
MELNFQVKAGVAAGATADTCEIDVAKNDNMSVAPTAYETNFFMSLNLTGSSTPRPIEKQVALKT